MATTGNSKSSSSKSKSKSPRKRRGVGSVNITVELSERDFNDLNLAYKQARGFDRTITRSQFRSQVMAAAVSGRLKAMKAAANGRG